MAQGPQQAHSWPRLEPPETEDWSEGLRLPQVAEPSRVPSDSRDTPAAYNLEAVGRSPADTPEVGNPGDSPVADSQEAHLAEDNRIQEVACSPVGIRADSPAADTRNPVDNPEVGSQVDTAPAALAQSLA